MFGTFNTTLNLPTIERPPSTLTW